MRLHAERIARGAALALVLWLLIRTAFGSPAGPSSASAAAGLSGALPRWTTGAPPANAHVLVDGPVSPAQRDWLAALAGAGTRLTWHAPRVAPIAAVVEPVADPAGATRVWVSAPPATTVRLADGVGPLDSGRVERGAGVSFLARSAPPAVSVAAGERALVARAAVRDSLRLGRLLVIGRVGWESKFVSAALEERGWRVDARLALSPKGDVLQGPGVPIDTGRYAAVIALDSSALAVARAIAQYVRDGGGLVLDAQVAGAAPFAALAAGGAEEGIPALEPYDSLAPEPRRALALVPIALRADAVPLERRDELVAVAARRIERGRVVTTGYDDTWRWRMGGGGDAVEAHRAWWAGLVASVAYVGRVAVAPDGHVDEAPYAHLVNALGAPSAPQRGRGPGGVAMGWWFAGVGTLLLYEWASRRMRGAP